MSDSIEFSSLVGKTIKAVIEPEIGEYDCEYVILEFDDGSKAKLVATGYSEPGSLVLESVPIEERKVGRRYHWIQ